MEGADARVEKRINAGVQAGAAIALCVGALGVMWGLGVFGKPPADAPAKAAACDAPKAGDAPEYPALCAALNRRDLPQLLGTPTEVALLADSAGGSFTYADGTKGPNTAAAEVQFQTYDVRITDDQDLSLKDFADTFTELSTSPTSVLGHAALTYSDHTMAISFNGGKTSSSESGGIARHLVVAKSSKPGGGSYEIDVWRQDGQTPDDAALFRVAAKVLPATPGWVTG